MHKSLKSFYAPFFTLLFGAMLLFATETAVAQTDTSFWFAAPEVASGHGDRPIGFKFTSQGQVSQVQISLPANPLVSPLQISVPASGVASIDLTQWIDSLENNPANTILNKGIHITASNPITAYYEVNRSNNPDIFSLKGRNALGTSFMIPGQDIMANAHGRNAFDIVATEDQTTITIIPTDTLVGGRMPGVPFTIVLNKGETFSCRSHGTNTYDKLIGSRVTSNKPIAITLIDDSVRGGSIYTGGCFDLLGDQLIPIAQLGMEFIVQRGFLNVQNNNTSDRTERVIVMAVENGTQVFLDGSTTAIATLSAGQTYHRRMGSGLPVTYIRTSKPAYVMHITGFGCETGWAVIPAIQCTGSSRVGFMRSTAERFGFTVITRTTNINAFSLNGNAYSISFAAVPGTNGEWQYARVERANNDTTEFNTSTGYILSNSSGNFHLGIINGGNSSGCRYGYFSGFSQVNVVASSNSTVEAPECQNQLVFLEADSTPNAIYVWTGPNGFSSNLRRIEFQQVTFADTGLYTVTATVDNCVSRIDSITIAIKPQPNQAAASNNGPNFCHGDTIRLYAATVPDVSYRWSGPNGFSSQLQNPIIASADFVNGGRYRLITELDGCSSDTTFTDIYVYPRPVITPLSATAFCRYDSVQLVTGGGVQYQWFRNNQLVSGATDSLLTVFEGGWYAAVVTNAFGCTDTAVAVLVEVYNLPENTLSKGDTSSKCVGDSLLLFTAGGFSYQWYSNGQLINGATDSFLVVNQSGFYQVRASDALDQCSVLTDSLEVIFYPYATAQLSFSDTSVCAGEGVWAIASGGAPYHWLRNDSLIHTSTNDSLWLTAAGRYQLVAGAGSCRDTSDARDLVVKALPTVSIDSAGPLSFCSGDSVILRSANPGSYQWFRNGAALSTDSFVVATQSGTYSLVLTNTNGCSDSSSVQLSAFSLPSAQIDSSGPLSFCSGDSVILRSANSGNYQWFRNGAAISSDSFVVATQSCTYSLVLTNANGCSDSASVSVTVFNLPVAQIDSTGPLAFCQGDSVILRSANSGNYQWFRNGAALSTDSFVVATQSGTYSLVLTNTNGCSDSASLAVTVFSLPVAQIDSSGPLSFCSSDSVILRSVNSGNYQWFRNGAAVSTDSIITVSTSGTYSLVLTNANGCSDSASLAVTVFGLPVAKIDSTGPLAFCQGDSVILRPANSGSYQWYRNGAAISSDSFVVVTQSGTYSLVLTDANGCSDSASVSVRVFNLPVAQIDSSGPLSFCSSDSVILRSANSGNHQWFRNGTAISSDSFVVATQSGTYSLVLTNANGCSDSASLAVTVFNIPVAQIDSTGPLAFCQGDSVVLRSANRGGYQWYRNGMVLSTDSFVVATQGGTYSLVLTNANGCSDSASVSVTVFNLPVAQIDSTGPLSFCSGDSVILRSANSGNYQWFRNGVAISSDSFVVATQSGTYSLVLTNTNSCSDSASLAVTVFGLPVAQIDSTGPLAFCQGDSVILRSANSGNYQWFRNGAAVSTDSFITVSTSGTYSLVLTNANGCSDSVSVSVTVFNLPVAQIDSSGPLAFCQGDSVILRSANSGNYQWFRNGVAISTDSLVVATQSGTYSLVLTNANGCSDSAGLAVNVFGLPVAQIDSTGPLAFCQGDSVVLRSANSGSYQWFRNGVAISSDSFVVATQSGTYSLVLTNTNSCSDSASLAVTVFNIPVAQIDSTGPLAFCQGDSVVLRSANSGNYQWFRNGAAVSTDSFITVSTSGTYSLVLTNASGCSDSANIAVTVFSLPVAQIDSTGPLSFCSGDSVILRSANSGSYQWYRNSVAISSDSFVVATQSGTYSLVLTNDNGCSDSASLAVTVFGLPVAQIDSSGPLSFCSGDSVILRSAYAGSYQWFRNGAAHSTDSFVVATQSGNYSLVLTNANGCSDSASLDVTVFGLPVAQIDSTGPLAFCQGDSVILRSANSGSYQWFRNGTAISTDSFVVATQSGTYSLVLTNANGCSDSASIAVTVFGLPVAQIDSTGPLAFCHGDSVILRSANSGNYQWFRNGMALSTDSFVVATQSGTYSLVLTNNNGCSDSASLAVTVFGLPVAQIDSSGPLAFCQGDSVILRSANPGSYQWFRNGVALSTDSFVVAHQSGTYSLVLTNTNGCSDSASVAVTVFNLPVAQIDSTGPLSFCSGDSVILRSVNSGNYQWFRNGAAVSTDSIITVSTSGTYSLLLTNANGCSDSASLAVTVFGLPVAQIDSSGPLAFCSGDSVILRSANTGSYQWYRNGAAISSDSFVVATQSGTYSLVLTNANGCSDSASLAVTVFGLPVAQIDSTGPLAFCQGDSVILRSANSGSYQWYRNGTALSTDSFVVATQSGTYSLVLTNTSGCSDSSSVAVTIFGLPVAQIDSTGPLAFCQGDSVILRSAYSGSYQWYRNGTALSTDSFVVATQSGTYSLVLTNANGCSDSASLAVTVFGLPVAQIDSTGPLAFCQGDSVILRSANSGSYQWYRNGTALSTDSFVVATQSGTYSLVLTNANGCSDSASLAVTVFGLPLAQIDSTGPLAFCQGDSVILRSANAGTYQWFRNGAAISSDSFVVATQSGTYSLVLTNDNGCSDSASLAVTVFGLPVAQIDSTGPLAFCQGDSVILRSANAGTYQWFRNGAAISSDSFVVATQSGTYSLVLTNTNSCSDSASLAVTVFNIPVAQIDSTGPLAFCQGDSVILRSANSGNYQWYRNGMALSTDSFVVATQSGTYSLVLTNANGCSDSASIQLTVFSLPVAQIDSSGPLSFCSGDSVILRSANSGSYQWFRNGVAISSDSFVVATQSGTYSLVLTNANGCSDSASLAVTVFGLPVAQIDSTGPLAFCQGDSVILRSANSGNYQWYRNGVAVSTDSFVVATQGGTYSLVLTNANGCSNSASVSVTVFNLPVAQIDSSGPLAFCQGDSVILRSANSGSYQWFRNGAALSTDSFVVATQGGTYSLLITNANGCSDSASLAVTVFGLPVAQIDSSGPLAFCQGDSVILRSANPGSYQWFRNGAALSTDSFVVATQSGTYSLVLTNANGCSDSASVQITVFDLPLAQIDSTGPLAFCQGDSVILRSANAGTYQWFRNGMALSTDSFVVAAQSGTYSLVLTNANGCSDSSSVQLTAFSLPSAQIDSSGPLSFCSGDSVILRSANPGSYQWFRNGAALSTDSFVVATQGGTYSLVITNANGCSDSASLAVTVFGLPVAQIDSSGPLSFCSGDSVILRSANTGSYQWYRNGAALSTDSFVVATQSGTYSLVLTNANGCSDSASVAVTVFNLPVAQIDSSGRLAFCAGDSVILRSTYAGSYQWFRNGAAHSTDSFVVATQSGNYSLVLTNANGCSDSASLAVTVFGLPVAQIDSSGPLSFCSGDSVILRSANAGSYQWFRNGTAISSDPFVVATQSGTYSLVSTNTNGCSDSASVAVTVFGLPVAQIDSTGPLAFCQGDSVILRSVNAGSYQWFRNGMALSTDSFVVATQSSTYSLVLTNANGCSDSASVAVTVLNLPDTLVQVMGSPQFCVGDSVVLQAPTGITYQWLLNGIPLAGANQQQITVGQGGSWTVRITNANGCSVESNAIQTAIVLPPVAFNMRANSLVKCTFDSILLEATFSPTATYLWYLNGNLLPGMNQNRLFAYSAGSYHCQVQYGSGCSQILPAVTIREYALPANLGLPDTIRVCSGQTFDISALLVADATYAWVGPDNFMSNMHRAIVTNVDFRQNGWYILRLTLPGCGSITDSVYVEVQNGLGEIAIEGKAVVCGDGRLKLRADQINDATYTWTLASGKQFYGAQLDASKLDRNDGGFASLTVQRGNCSEQKQLFVEYFEGDIFFPSAFTPNNDGLNEEFGPETRYEGELIWEVYDRWGNLVFRSTKADAKWDGSFKGESAAIGTYTWVCTSKNCSNQTIVNKGMIQLIR